MSKIAMVPCWPVIEAVHQLFPWLRHLFADSVYNRPNFLPEALAKFGEWTIEIGQTPAGLLSAFSCCRGAGSSERTLA